MQTTDLPELSDDEQALLAWALGAEREYRTRFAHLDGVRDRCSGLPFNPQAHPDHHAPTIWAHNPAWQSAYERTNWQQLYLDTYRRGWIHGGKGHVLLLTKMHFPPKEEGWHYVIFQDARGYEWYPIEATSSYRVKCDGCGTVNDTGWCSDLPGGSVEMRCNRCIQVTQEVESS